MDRLNKIFDQLSDHSTRSINVKEPSKEEFMVIGKTASLFTPTKDPITLNNDYVAEMTYNHYKQFMNSNIEWINHFYEESPNWINNNDINNMSSTIQWINLNDSEKTTLLDNDLAVYFNPTTDGEL